MQTSQTRCFSLFFFFSLFLLFSKERQPSYPYITGDGFRAYADYILDEDSMTLNPEQMKDYDVVFVKTEYCELFFSVYHPRITKKYILITHNSDQDVPGPYYSYLSDPLLIVWFGQNLCLPQSAKLRVLPIGLTNQYNALGHPEWMSQVIKKRKIKEKQKKYLAYFNVTLQTCLNERKRAFDYFHSKSFCKTMKSSVCYSKFLNDLLCAKYTISPRGNGLDCHRTWEALYAGSIPIVKSSNIDPLFEHLPALIVNDWDEVTEGFLNDNYEKIKNKLYKEEKLFMDYWIEQIESYKFNH